MSEETEDKSVSMETIRTNYINRVDTVFLGKEYGIALMVRKNYFENCVYTL